MLQLCCISVVCTVKKISPSESKFHVVTVIEAVVSNSRMFNIISCFECVIVLVIPF
jgi:hypothetical protein